MIKRDAVPNKPLLLGHRGARYVSGVAENTIDAFDLALRHGCDGFEFDVRCTPSGTPVICHDPKFGRKSISRLSDKELTSLPRLNSVLELYASRAFLDVEIKVPGVENATLSVLQKHVPHRGYVVSSFLPNVLSELRRLSYSVVLGYICDSNRDLPLWRELDCDFVIVQQRLVTSNLIEEVHGSGKHVLAWTVNRPQAMRRMADLGVDGIISDNPEELCRTLGRARKP